MSGEEDDDDVGGEDNDDNGERVIGEGFGLVLREDGRKEDSGAGVLVKSPLFSNLLPLLMLLDFFLPLTNDEEAFDCKAVVVSLLFTLLRTMAFFLCEFIFVLPLLVLLLFVVAIKEDDEGGC